MKFPPSPVTRIFASHRFCKPHRIASIAAVALVLSTSFTGLFALTTQNSFANHSECSDGKDNDNDTLVDYPQDDDCQNLDDDFEGIGLTGNFVTVTDGHERVQAGEAVVYVITLKQQRETSRNVNVTFHLPHQANVNGASDGGSIIENTTVRWTNVSVYKNVTRTLTVNVNTNPNAENGQYLVARVNVDGSEATDTTLIQDFVATASDTYRVSITDGRDFVQPETNLTYTIRVRNTSSQSRTTDVRASMPYTTNFLSASDNGKRDSYNVTWRNEFFQPNEEKMYTFTTRVDRQATDRTSIRARAYVGTINAMDETIVRFGLPYDAVSATITDNRNTAEIGQLLTYTVRVSNNSDLVATQVAVDASVPAFAEFVSASEGGFSDGNNIRWLIIQIAPHDTRTLSFTARVRSDATIDSVLTAGVVADGANGAIAHDKTTVVFQSNELGLAPREVMFRKTADRSEAVPGGSIRYTLFIRNTLNTVISDATVLDRYDTQYLSMQSTDSKQFLVSNEDGRMVWQVPVLKPGETWTASYTLSVASGAPTGMKLDNVATLRGSDVSGISLTERVSTNTSGVFGDFPATGAGMDVLLALVSAVFALGAAIAQKKLALTLSNFA